MLEPDKVDVTLSTPFTSCMTLGKSKKFFVSYFSIKDNGSVYIELVEKLRKRVAYKTQTSHISFQIYSNTWTVHFRFGNQDFWHTLFSDSTCLGWMAVQVQLNEWGWVDKGRKKRLFFLMWSYSRTVRDLTEIFVGSGIGGTCATHILHILNTTLFIFSKH